MFKWDDISIPMSAPKFWNKKLINNINKETQYNMNEEEHYRITMNNTEYKKIKIDEVIENQTHLNNSEKNALTKLLKDNEDLFKGTKGHWPGDKIKLQLIHNNKPYSGRAYCIPVSL